jgi:hypothetical protein
MWGATDRPGEAGAVLSFRDESAQPSERMHERIGESERNDRHQRHRHADTTPPVETGSLSSNGHVGPTLPTRKGETVDVGTTRSGPIGWPHRAILRPHGVRDA